MNLKLKELRKKAGMTQADLSEKAAIKLGTLRTWEQGTASMKLEDAIRICDAIGCTPNDLCGWYDEHPRDDTRSALPPEEAELMRNYRACTPQWRSNISMTARAAAGEAREEAERAASAVQVSEAV